MIKSLLFCGAKNKPMKTLFLLPILLLVSVSLISSQNQFLFLDHEASRSYIDYLLNSGQINPAFVLQQPYNSFILSTKDNQNKWDKYFSDYWQEFYGEKNTSVGFHFHNNAVQADGMGYQYRGDFNFFYHTKHIAFVNRTTVDSRYKNDPLYAGDLSESDHWLYGRVNDAYMNISYGDFDFFVGRMARNWGPLQSPGLLISDNPYTYDQIYFSYNHYNLKFSWIFAPLDDVQGIEFEPEKDSTYVDWGASRRFINGHRLDLRIADNFQIGLTEMAIYGGADRRFELAFANPMTFYYGVQRNDHKGMSGLWALDLFWKPKSQISFYGQFLIDDIMVNNDPGVDDRKIHPDRLGLVTSLRLADLPVDGFNFDFSYSRIWNRTYQSLRSWENYHYRGLGLGYPCASCEEFMLKIAYWDLFPFYFENEFIAGRYGDVTLRDMFPIIHEPFPFPPSRNIQVNIFSMYYLWRPNMRFNIKASYFSDMSHYMARYYKNDFTLYVGFDWFINTSWVF